MYVYSLAQKNINKKIKILNIYKKKQKNKIKTETKVCVQNLYCKHHMWVTKLYR